VVSQTTAVWALEFNQAILADASFAARSSTPATLCEVTDTPNAAITLTDKAAEKIGELLSGQAEGTEQALRVAVRGGGCSGFQYALAFDKPKDDDNVFEVDGVAVVVDKVSMQFVFGSEVDYVEGLQGAGFQVNNPNVVAACGCGSSFQVKDDAPAAEHAAV
jgi:iron-sulfur cluster assembly protein